MMMDRRKKKKSYLIIWPTPKAKKEFKNSITMNNPLNITKEEVEEIPERRYNLQAGPVTTELVRTLRDMEPGKTLRLGIEHEGRTREELSIQSARLGSHLRTAFLHVGQGRYKKTRVHYDYYITRLS